MERVWRESTKLLAGLFFITGSALPQAYTISAKPGAVNYIEGVAYLDGNVVGTGPAAFLHWSRLDRESSGAGSLA